MLMGCDGIGRVSDAFGKAGKGKASLYPLFAMDM